MKKITFLLLATLLVACSGNPLAGGSAEMVYDADYARGVCAPRPVDDFNSSTGEVNCSEDVGLKDQVVQPPDEIVVESQAADTNQVSECPQAADLGPWAPNNGLGEDFEVTANETVSSGVHLQLWWPGDSGQEWGMQEISVFLPPGLSVEVQDGAGRGWEYSLSCSMSEIEVQMTADHERRSTDTSYWGVVDIDFLIETGLVEVRFDRR